MEVGSKLEQTSPVGVSSTNVLSLLLLLELRLSADRDEGFNWAQITTRFIGGISRQLLGGVRRCFPCWVSLQPRFFRLSVINTSF